MHHSSIDSGGVYIQPKSSHVRTTLTTLKTKMTFKYYNVDSDE